MSPVVSLWKPRASSAVPKVRLTQVRCGQIASLIILLGLMLIRINMMIEHAETLPPDQIYDPINAYVIQFLEYETEFSAATANASFSYRAMSILLPD